MSGNESQEGNEPHISHTNVDPAKASFIPGESAGEGLKDSRTQGLKDSRTQGLKDSRTQGLKDSRTQGLKDSRTQGLKNSRTQGLKDSRTQGLKDSRTQGLKDSRTQGLKDSRTQGLKDSRMVRNSTRDGRFFLNSRILDYLTPSRSSACGTQASGEANEQISLLTLPNNRNDVIAAVRRKFKTDVFSGRDNRDRN